MPITQLQPFNLANTASYTFGNVTATGNVSGGNILTTGIVSATGNVTGNYIFGNGALLTGVITSVSNINNGTSNVTVVSSGGNISVGVGGTGNVAVWATTGEYITGLLSVSGNITAGNVLGGANVNATTHTGTTVSVTGNITAGNLTVGTGIVAVGSIVNNNANGVGNIGSSSLYFNTVFAKATSAQYADLAEMYSADQNYEPGTVVVFGGANEITISQQPNDHSVAGVISTNPSYLMNSTMSGNFVLPVALVGRVPCWVVGNINKGDRLVTSPIPGVATKMEDGAQTPGILIGKALESYSSDAPGMIEVAVGRS